jgi:hypothetical protein
VCSRWDVYAPRRERQVHRWHWWNLRAKRVDGKEFNPLRLLALYAGTSGQPTQLPTEVSNSQYLRVLVRQVRGKTEKAPSRSSRARDRASLFFLGLKSYGLIRPVGMP